MRYWIGLGSNLGDRLSSLHAARTALETLGRVERCSRVYASSPVGGPPQAPFLNAALLLDSALEPEALLVELQRLETEAGRDRAAESVRWGPRPLDLDLLLAGARGEVRHESPTLTLPHPRVHERLFTLLPLLDLDGTLVHPLLGRPLKALASSAQALGHAVAPTGDSLNAR